MTTWLKAIGLGLCALGATGLEASPGTPAYLTLQETSAPFTLVTPPPDSGVDSALTVLSGFFLSARRDPHCFTILGLERHPKNRLVIFDATGREVWSCENYRNQWCGPARPGMYYYVLELPDGTTRSGTLKVSG